MSCHAKLYPLKLEHLATQLVHALSLFYVLKRRNSCCVAMELHGYVTAWLHGCVATWLRSHEAKQLGNCETNLTNIWVYININ